LDEREKAVLRRRDAQELYGDTGPGLEALQESRLRGKQLAWEFNQLQPRDLITRQRLLGNIFGTLGEAVWVEPPLHVAYGINTHIGSHIYMNTGMTILDDSPVHIGNRVMIAPHVTLATDGHPLHPATRATGQQFSAPIRIEDDVWLGANVTVLPGVIIGQGSVVAAGAVVNAHVPPNVVVGGVPARILRTITDADRDFTYRAPHTLTIGQGL
jgi:galactoside O-acetyltransferase